MKIFKDFVLLIALIIISQSCSHKETNDSSKQEGQTNNQSPPIGELSSTSSTANGRSFAPSDSFRFAFNVDVKDVIDDSRVYYFSSSVSTSPYRNKLKNKIFIGYLSIGSSENWRDDYEQLKKYNYKKYANWSGEYWLDISKWREYLPVMHARIDKLKSNGFDCLYLDNVSSWKYSSTIEEMVKYLEAVSSYAHFYGMCIGINGGYDVADKVVSTYDFLIVENPQKYKELHYYDSFVKAGKPVHNLVYDSKDCYKIPGHQVQQYDLELTKRIKLCDTISK